MMMVVVEIMVSDCICFFFQAEDGIRDLVRSRGLGDVYKRQVTGGLWWNYSIAGPGSIRDRQTEQPDPGNDALLRLSLIHI